MAQELEADRKAAEQGVSKVKKEPKKIKTQGAPPVYLV
jgi:hypothetical protein